MDIEKLKLEAQNKALHIADVSGSALFNADCMDILPLIPDKSVQLILADLPYGVTDLKWDCVLDLNKLWKEYTRISDTIILFGKQPFTTDLINVGRKWFKYELIWEKDKPTNFALANKQPMCYHENILLFSNKQTTYNKIMVDREGKGTWRYDFDISHENRLMQNGKKYQGKKEKSNYDTKLKNPKSILYYDTGKRQHLQHQTQKPLDLIKWLIYTYSNEGEIVLDNTMGVGTTCLGAKELNRKFIGIEKEVKYYDLAVARMFGQHCH